MSIKGLKLNQFPGIESNSLKSRKFALNLLQIVMIIIALLFLFPAYLVLINSFKDNSQIILNPLSLPASFDFSNYINAWRETNFPAVFLNTLLITVLSTTGIIVVSSMAAYILVRTRNKISWLLYLFFVFNMIVPFQTIMIPLNITATSLNLKNVYGIIPIYIGLLCPLAVFMYHGFIKTVPAQIEESAAIDGASIFQIFFQVVFPILKPVHATVAIINVLWIWNDFLLPLIILPSRSTIQLAQYIFFGMFRQEFSLAMASLILSASPVILFYLLMQKQIIKGVAAGAIKG
ncbi:MAG: carbohydrate ABC transporter permease [Halanaerobiales bacterium]|nr:carbohydrate ABC transporter permease [Halanaerobiales bacterium]